MNPANANGRRVLVLEPDDQLATAISDALKETDPGITVDRTNTLEEAQKVVVDTKPDLFVLDVDAATDLTQDFLYDLRTSHPNARAIILTAVHLAAARERTAGLGAIHLLEKPFPHGDFVDLVQALLQPKQSGDAEKFQGTLSDLHIADIIQLKSMSGATTGIELTGPNAEKGRVYFDRGQVRHATAGEREGLEAFNEIMTWKGGRMSEIPAETSKQTIDLDWQVLVMEAARNLDEQRAAMRGQKPSGSSEVEEQGEKVRQTKGNRSGRDFRVELQDIDVVFHEAAYGGYMPEIAKYVHVNSYGTALMLEVIREKNLPIKKIVVASSQAVYSEGAGTCPKHGLVFPAVRPVEQLRRGDWEVHCPLCDAITNSVPTPENAPVGGETVYGLTKVDQEKLVLLWGKQVGIPTVALRYSCTYGPRQSIFNPYTGVIAIFCTRLLNNLPPVLYEDGEQTRDFSFAEDIARANLLAAESDQLSGVPVNVGSCRGVPIREIAEHISEALGISIAPEAKGEFRPGEMRHLTSDTTLIAGAGYKPLVELPEGIGRYLDWIRGQGDVRDYFSEAENILRDKGIVHRVAAGRQ